MQRTYLTCPKPSMQTLAKTDHFLPLGLFSQAQKMRNPADKPSENRRSRGEPAPGKRRQANATA
jgi:hypothetical protein